MDKSIVKGCHFQDRQRKYELQLPSAREYKILTVKNADEILPQSKLIREAVKVRSQTLRKRCHNSPVLFQRNGNAINVRASLHQILAKHPFPLLQGPLIFHLDSSAYIIQTEKEMLVAKTIFSHSESQECGEWTPIQSGLDGWRNISNCTSGSKEFSETYKFSEISESDYRIQGPSSSIKNMNLLYTCQIQKCIIQCSCSICIENNEQCKENCKSKICKDCTQQCNQHNLKLPWLFNPNTDHFTMVTQDINYFQYATPYAGIPLSCNSCSKDILEHQILHLVVHLKCKFCCLEFRPFEKESVVTAGDFCKVEKKMIQDEDRTCSICFVKCKNRLTRRRHEIKHHGKREKKHICKICDKSYFYRSSLKHHNDTKHEANREHPCELCSEMFSSYIELTEHKRGAHIDESECRDCGKSFKYEKNMLRHMKEFHRYTNTNLDYAPKENDLFRCKECDETFLRKSNLKRHKDTIHGERPMSKCPSCDQEFSRKDNLRRHMKKHIS